MKKKTKKAIDEITQLYEEPQPELIIYSHNLIEGKKKDESNKD